MLAVPHLYADIEQLPANLQVEVSHYVSFLLEKIKKLQAITEPTLTEQQKTLQNDVEEDNSQKILALMNEISSRPNSFSGIDGVEWQKEQRQDKVLFGREEY